MIFMRLGLLCSLFKKVYEMSVKTKGSPRDFNENNRVSGKGLGDFHEENAPILARFCFFGIMKQ